MLQQWRANLEVRRPLTEHSLVCEDHFRDEDIIRWIETPLSNGQVHRCRRGVPKLKCGSIPTIKQAQCSKDCTMDKTSVDTEGGHLEGDQYLCCISQVHSEKLPDNVSDGNAHVTAVRFHSKQNVSTANVQLENTVSGASVQVMDEDNLTTNVDSQDLAGTSSTSRHVLQDSHERWNFEKLLSCYSEITLPSRMWAAIVDEAKQIVTFLTVGADEVFRRVQIHNDMTVHILVDEIPIRVKCVPHIVTCAADVANIVKSVNDLVVCKNFKEAKRLL